MEIIECLAAGLIHFSEFRDYLSEQNKFVPNTLYKRLKEFYDIGLITHEYSRVRENVKTYHPTDILLQYAEILVKIRSLI